MLQWVLQSRHASWISFDKNGSEIQREIRYGILIVLHFRCEGYQLSTSMEHFVRRLVHRKIPILFVFMTNFSFLKLIFLFHHAHSFFNILISCKPFKYFLTFLQLIYLFRQWTIAVYMPLVLIWRMVKSTLFLERILKRMWQLTHIYNPLLRNPRRNGLIYSIETN